MGEILAAARAELARVEEEYRLAQAAYAREKADFQREIVRLRRVVASFRDRPRRSAAVQAGPKALDAVRVRLAAGGRRATQLAITKDTGLNAGTVTYALRALVEAGEVESTGRWVGGSREFRLLGRVRRRAA